MNTIVLPCEYCSRPTPWPTSIAAAGIPPCCPRCRVLPLVLAVFILLCVAVLAGLMIYGWWFA